MNKIAFLLFTLLPAAFLQISALSAAELLPAAPEEFVFSPNRETKLHFTGSTDAPEYTITDYHARRIGSGTLHQDGETLWSATVKLPPGFYELNVDGRTFGVLAIEPFSGEPDPFFGADCAMSWLVPPQPETLREMLVQLLHRSGIGVVRERMSWPEIAPEPGKFDFEGGRKNRSLRSTYRENGIRLLDVIHNAPAYLGYSTATPYPDDLAATARAFEQISRAHDPAFVAHREIWNEPDLQGHDRFFPVADAIIYALRRAGTGVTIAGPVLSQHPSEVFLLRLADDEQLPLFDVFTFHDYRAPEKMASTAEKYRTLLEDAGAFDCPMWITESGKEWTQQPVRPRMEDDKCSASWNVRRALEARVAGIDAFFAFVLTYYPEGIVNYGMLDKHHTPLRSFAAYAEMVRRLSHLKYIGKLENPDGYVFSDNNGNATVALARGNAPGAIENFPFPVSAACGIDGRALAFDNGKFEWDDDLIYLETTMEALRGHFTPANRTAKVRREPRLVRKPSAVVIDPVYEETPLQFRAFVYQAEATGEFELPLKLWNLADTPATIRLQLEYPPEYDLPGGAVPVETLTLPPGECTRYVVHFPLRPIPPENGYYLPFKLRAFDDEAGTVATRTVPILVSPKLEDVLKQYAVCHEIPVADPQRPWSENATPGSELKQEIRDGSFHLAITFPPKVDPWVYPQQRLIPTPEFARFDTVIARVRMTGAGDCRILLQQESKSSFMTPWRRLVTDNGEWNLVIVPFSSFVPMNFNETAALDPAKLNQIAIGFNSRSPDRKNTFEVSALYFAGERK